VRDLPEVYELIKQLEYYYNIALNIKSNLENVAGAVGEPSPHPATERRFLKFKEQVDQHIAELIDELQHAKNGALNS